MKTKYLGRDEVGTRRRDGRWRGMKQYSKGDYTPVLAVGLGMITLRVLQLAVIAGLGRYERCQLRYRTYIQNDRPERSLRSV